MKCSLCGYEFKEKEVEEACKGCPSLLTKPCGMIKCPNCGYEIPLESRLEKFLKKFRGKEHEDKR
ncbi:MAG: hypothetical protein HY929_04155 [Euryarchaeota archaeon]|nr:hypothetical protein [Euryarchaeota archaeon]